MAKALRDIERLMGKSYKRGDVIPDEVVGMLSAQTMRALVEGGYMGEIPGMEAAASSGMSQHLKAKVEILDRQNAEQKQTIAQLQASHDDLAKRVSDLEGGAGGRKTRRETRKAKE